MPQLTLPFFYVNEFASTALGLGVALVLAGCYLLPEATASSLSRVSLSAIILSPLEQFEVYSFFDLGLLGGTLLSVTTVTLYVTLALTAAGIFFYATLPALLPSRVSLGIETLTASLLSLVRNQISPHRESLTPVIFTLFTFILLLNLIGNVPYNYTPTTSLIASIGLSVTLWVWLTLESLATLKWDFFAQFVPSGTPLVLVPLLVLIEVVSYTARAASLGVRLFSNILAGHTLLAILSGFLAAGFSAGLLPAVLSLAGFALFIALVALELAVSFIQAFVFTVLVANYVEAAPTVCP